MTKLTTTHPTMRLRAAALLVALAAILPAAASAQQMAALSPAASAVAGSSSGTAAGAPISRRDRVSLESRLHHVALLQELYWTEHRTYTTDLAALEPSALTAPKVEILSASAEGWTARAELSSAPGVGCTMSVGAPTRGPAGPVVASSGTAHGRRARDAKSPHPGDRPTLVCDR